MDIAEQCIKFLLVPDGSSSRRVRRHLAERGARSGVVVGTWLELVALARNAYLLPEPANDWGDLYGVALQELDDAFWSKSLQVAPVETADAVYAALIQILAATDPVRGLAGLESVDLPNRAHTHLADLVRLIERLAGQLPPELMAIRELLDVPRGDALHSIHVLHHDGLPALSRWQIVLIGKLNQDAGATSASAAGNVEFQDALIEVADTGAYNSAVNSLTILQQRLFDEVEERPEPDDSVQWIGVRDFLQEAEVAAGMAQRMLDNNPSLKPADIGLLVPDSAEYSMALADAFELGGLRLSGLPVAHRRRDHGREVLFHFLACRHYPAPIMAQAALLTSPLMPWSRKRGVRLAQNVMDQKYQLQPYDDASANACAMLELIDGDDSEPASLGQALQAFVDLLKGNADTKEHVAQAKHDLKPLLKMLETPDSIDWPALRREVVPRFVKADDAPDFNIEGVTVWRESQEPWRRVTHLIVLGFAQGHYPAARVNSPVFSADDLDAIRTNTELPVSTPADELKGERDRFKRLLKAAADSVTFLVPRRTAAGEPQSPSESLVFMHQLFSGPESAEERIIDLDTADGRERVRNLALAVPAPPTPPRELVAEDLQFDCDLLAINKDKEGNQKPESPSNLDKLMVSRLAWLLRRLNAVPKKWETELADPLILGSLAHKVFEDLFRPAMPLPKRENMAEKVEHLLGNAIDDLAPFLSSSQWRVERKNLVASTTQAANTWLNIVEKLGAEVLASEVWLQGTWSGTPIHGQVDLILGLPDGGLLVVDYKRSKSKGRQTQMTKGYDSQASLYRKMLSSGGPKDDADEELLRRIHEATQTGIIYYTLLDGCVLADAVLPDTDAIPGWHSLDNDVAEYALALIRRRLDEVRAGCLHLNREGDAEFFKKQAGITPYALDDSPLIPLFTIPGEVEEAR